MPLVSVLMPCYNAAATLEQTLDSLTHQTFDDFEIVAVDDGSEDSTLSILNACARQNPRLQVFTQTHQGIIAALNEGLLSCQASYVARMDADDYAYPERLALQISYLDTHPDVDVLGCQVEAFPEKNVRGGFRVYLSWLNSLLDDADIRREIFVESPLPHPGVMFRRAVVLAAGAYQDHGWAEDYDLWLRLYLQGCHFAKVPQVLLAWRERPERLTRQDQRYSLENFLRAKAHYLAQGPLQGRDAVFIWGAGMMGRRFSKYIVHQGQPLQAFVDIDPRKIGHTRRGAPVIAPEQLLLLWQRHRHPILLAAVGARGARKLIRARLEEMGLVEGQDWWGVA
jgi:glycosyltransferase involved in cell wall biosynthesis